MRMLKCLSAWTHASPWRNPRCSTCTSGRAASELVRQRSASGALTPNGNPKSSNTDPKTHQTTVSRCAGTEITAKAAISCGGANRGGTEINLKTFSAFTRPLRSNCWAPTGKITKSHSTLIFHIQIATCAPNCKQMSTHIDDLQIPCVQAQNSQPNLQFLVETPTVEAQKSTCMQDHKIQFYADFSHPNVISHIQM